MHPVAGQGFNLVLRDINKLQVVLKYYTGLGMSLKSCPPSFTDLVAFLGEKAT